MRKFKQLITLSFLGLFILPTFLFASEKNNSIAPIKAGLAAFTKKCAFCHNGFSTGAIMLGRRLGEEKAELYKRKDLSVPYIKSIVRNGLASMPAITRVEVTDEQLHDISIYLTRNNSLQK